MFLANSLLAYFCFLHFVGLKLVSLEVFSEFDFEISLTVLRRKSR